MKKFLALALALVMVLCLFAGCGNDKPASTPNTGDTSAPAGDDKAPADDGKVYEFSLTCHDPIGTAQVDHMVEWATEVEELTGGRVKITIYDSATICAATDVATNVMQGAVDIGWLYTAYFAGQFPLADVVNLPFQGFGDCVATTQMFWDMMEEYPALVDEWSEFKVLMLYTNPGMKLVSGGDPITSIADLQGKSIRCPSGAITDLLTEWGANPITMAPPEIYEALEKGVVNGYIFEESGLVKFSLHELSTYYTDYPMYNGVFGLVMNKESWESLPADLQEIIEGTIGREMSIHAAEIFAADVDAGREKILAAGGEFVEIPAESLAEFQVAADAYAAGWVEKMTTADFDAAAFLARAKELTAQYEG